MKLRTKALAILAIAFTLLVAAVLTAGEMLTKRAVSLPGNPPLDLHARAVSIKTPSGGVVSGWLASGSNKGAVLLLHGVRGDRRHMLGRARFLHRAGFAIMLIDLPAHRESTGNRITFGWREAEAVSAALAQLRKLFPGAPTAIVGSSLGAASAVFATFPKPPDAVVLEAMYPSITEAVADRLNLHLGPWGSNLAPLLLWQMPLRLDISESDLQPIKRLPSLGAPVLIIGGSMDEHTTLAETKRLYEAAREPKQLWIVEGAAHTDLHAYDQKQYEKRVLAFLRLHMHMAG